VANRASSRATQLAIADAKNSASMRWRGSECEHSGMGQFEPSLIGFRVGCPWHRAILTAWSSIRSSIAVGAPASILLARQMNHPRGRGQFWTPAGGSVSRRNTPLGRVPEGRAPLPLEARRASACAGAKPLGLFGPRTPSPWKSSELGSGRLSAEIRPGFGTGTGLRD
jgi:hypothetical protein